MNDTYSSEVKDGRTIISLEERSIGISYLSDIKQLEEDLSREGLSSPGYSGLKREISNTFVNLLDQINPADLHGKVEEYYRKDTKSIDIHFEEEFADPTLNVSVLDEKSLSCQVSFAGKFDTDPVFLDLVKMSLSLGGEEYSFNPKETSSGTRFVFNPVTEAGNFLRNAEGIYEKWKDYEGGADLRDLRRETNSNKKREDIRRAVENAYARELVEYLGVSF